MQLSIQGLVFYFCLQPNNLWLFCYISVSIIAHNTAVNTTQHSFVKLQVNMLRFKTHSIVLPEWTRVKILIFSCKARKPKVWEIFTTEVFALMDQKSAVRQREVCLLRGVCVSSCLCGFPPACPPVSCLCVSDCPVWPVINWVTCDNRVLRRCLGEQRGVRHLKKGLRIAPELYVSFRNFKINCITHCGPPAFTFLNTLA